MSEFIKELKSKIEKLEDDVEFKEAEFQLLQSELQDTLSPAVASMQLNQIVLGMLIELMEFTRLKGVTKKSEDSKYRLLKIMSLIALFDGVTEKNYSLQASNKYLLGLISKLRLSNAELKQQISKMTKAENF